MRLAMSSFRFNHEGGIERASYELAAALDAAGVDVTLVASDVDPAPPTAWLRVDMPPVPSFVVPSLYPRRATAALRGGSFDVLHNQGACALMRQDVITAHSCHRAWWQMKLDSGERTRAFLNPLHHSVLATERRNYRPGAYRKVIAVSDGVGRELTRWYGVPREAIRVIPNAVDLEKFRSIDASDARRRVRARHGIRSDARVMVWIGKEFRRKGLAAAIDAVPYLEQDVVLLVVGGDDPAPYRAQAAALAVADRVIFAGHSPRAQDYFAAGDVFVFPTLYEAFALVSLEAAASGLPLLTTRVNGTEDFVVDGETGFFIDRDGASIARAARRLFDDDDLRARIGEAARARAGQYTWERVAKRTLEVYEEVIAEKNDPRNALGR